MPCQKCGAATAPGTNRCECREHHVLIPLSESLGGREATHEGSWFHSFEYGKTPAEAAKKVWAKYPKDHSALAPRTAWVRMLNGRAGWRYIEGYDYRTWLTMDMTDNHSATIPELPVLPEGVR